MIAGGGGVSLGEAFCNTYIFNICMTPSVPIRQQQNLNDLLSPHTFHFLRENPPGTRLNPCPNHKQ